MILVGNINDTLTAIVTKNLTRRSSILSVDVTYFIGETIVHTNRIRWEREHRECHRKRLEQQIDRVSDEITMPNVWLVLQIVVKFVHLNQW